jgi:hypothetical protein
MIKSSKKMLEKFQTEDDLLALNQSLCASDQLTSLDDPTHEKQVTTFTRNIPSLP